MSNCHIVECTIGWTHCRMRENQKFRFLQLKRALRRINPAGTEFGLESPEFCSFIITSIFPWNRISFTGAVKICLPYHLSPSELSLLRENQKWFPAIKRHFIVKSIPQKRNSVLKIKNSVSSSYRISLASEPNSFHRNPGTSNLSSLSEWNLLHTKILSPPIGTRAFIIRRIELFPPLIGT